MSFITIFIYLFIMSQVEYKQRKDILNGKIIAPKQKQWIIQIGENNYQIVFIFRQFQLKINEKYIKLKRSFAQGLIGIDQSFYIGNKECRLVSIGKWADIVVDGVYSELGKQYIPLKKIPGWYWICAAFCIAITFISLLGGLSLLIAFNGVVYCLRISISPFLEKSKRILYCLGVLVICWGLFEFLLFSFSF